MLSEKNKKYFYWFALVLSAFIIINALFNPFGVLTEVGIGIIPIILYLFSSYYFIVYSSMKILSIIFFPIVFYFLYKISINRIYPIYFLYFIAFVLLSFAFIIPTLNNLYICRDGGDWGCLLPFLTIPIIIISSLLAYFFYKKSEGLK
jgi:hypothetical protein